MDGDGSLMRRAELDAHLKECPRCRILCDTTRRTVELYKKAICCGVPVEVESRLMSALAVRALGDWRAGGTRR